MLDIVKFNTYKNLKKGSQVDFDGKFEFQCVDLMRDYARYAEYPPITTYGNAYDLWIKWLGSNYTRVYNTISAVPPVWAIIFWKQWKYGHVAIAWRANILWVEVLEQNGWSGNWDWEWTNAIRIRKDFYKNCVGWFIKKK